jgi:high-affinity nickel-transport protein
MNCRNNRPATRFEAMTAQTSARTATGSLRRSEWLSIGGMTTVVLALNVVGWATLLALVVPHHYVVGGGQVFGVGIGLTAWTLGMRHAFDADHIAAIDGTTRSLMAAGRRPVSVGFWFSLGHSSVVFGLCVLLSIGVRALAGPVRDGSSSLHHYTGLVGLAVSGTFLVALGVVNLVVLLGIVGMLRGMRAGGLDQVELERRLASRGLLNRVLAPATRAVRKPWHMYPVGLLFGLGFDTATEVSLLVIAGGAAVFSLPWYAILTLPVLFAAGMSLFDSIDGCFMNFAYGWAFAQPVRKVFYNLTVTALSVVVALAIGTVELVSLAVQQLGVVSGPLAAVGGLDLNHVGFVVVGLFVLTWAVAATVWKVARVEERWRTR